MTGTRRRSARGTGAALLALACLAASTGCARFDDRLSAPFTPAMEPGAVSGGDQRTPDNSPPQSPDPGTPRPTAPPGPCTDPDPAVVATCLEPTSATVGVPGATAALIAESGGRVLKIEPEAEPVEMARIDPTGGRVVALALSPHYAEDRLLFALVSGGDRNRVVRVAPGAPSRSVIDVAAGASGGLAFVDGGLIVASGPEVVRFSGYSGLGAPDRPEVMARDLGRATGLCTAGAKVYVVAETDRGGVVRRVDGPGQSVWTWPEQRRTGGCATGPDSVSVALPDAERVDTVPLADGAVRGQPTPQAEHRYGRLTGVATISEKVLLATTTNKDGGKPGQTDDRAVILPNGGGGGDSRV